MSLKAPPRTCLWPRPVPTTPPSQATTFEIKILHKAASVGDLEKVKEYLQLKKRDVNVRDRQYR